MTFFRFDSFSNIRWAFSQIIKARAPLNQTKGLQFYKLFGLGGGHGYSLKNKFNRYGFLGVWEDREQADRFFGGPLFSEFKRRSQERYTIFMLPRSSRGSWSGFQDWRPRSDGQPAGDLVCVLTRATLRPRYVFRFFSQIAKVVRDHKDREGLILTQGFSELPLIEQATFSIWENETLMKNFAYRSAHAEVIRMTRKYGGFREEMYTRMEPIETEGTWKGTDPLLPYLQQAQRMAS
jgi:hypothetical protein